MARAGRKDRGLLSRTDSAGRVVWCVRLWHDGKERRFGSFKTKTEARDFYEKAKQEQKTGRFFPERYQHGGYEFVQDAIDRYLATSITKKDQRGNRCFARWWGEFFRGRRLNHVTTVALDQAREKLSTKGCSPQRVNRYMEWVRHLLNLAVRDGKLLNNPATKLTMFKEPAGRTRFLTAEEEAKLYAILGPTYARWVRFAILTGLRRAEQFTLRWTDVDLERGLLTLSTTKAGGVQHVHLNDEARTILRDMDSWQQSCWVFPSQNIARHINSDNFYKRVYKSAVQKAGLEGVTWHTLRHTFASRLAMAGVTDYDIAACLRHSSTALVRRYAHLSPTHLQGVMERVSAFGKTPAS